MHVERITEIAAGSPKGFEEAIETAMKRATQTLRHVQGAWVESMEVEMGDDDKIAEYKVNLKVTFRLEDSA